MNPSEQTGLHGLTQAHIHIQETSEPVAMLQICFQGISRDLREQNRRAEWASVWSLQITDTHTFLSETSVVIKVELCICGD